MKPSIGRIVHYKLSEQDATAINRRRQDASTPLAADLVKDGIGTQPRTIAAMGTGAQVHVGNHVTAGDVFPMLITRVWSDTPESAVQGQVFLDGNDVLWATSVCHGDGEHQYTWPGRVD